MPYLFVHATFTEMGSPVTTRILALVGSLRAGSYNKQLAEAAVKYAPDGVAVDIFENLADVAFYNEDIDRPGAVAAADWLRVEVQSATRCYSSRPNTTAASRPRSKTPSIGSRAPTQPGRSAESRWLSSAYLMAVTAGCGLTMTLAK